VALDDAARLARPLIVMVSGDLALKLMSAPEWLLSPGWKIRVRRLTLSGGKAYKPALAAGRKPGPFVLDGASDTRVADA
jgi:hypothetical protein